MKISHPTATALILLVTLLTISCGEFGHMSADGGGVGGSGVVSHGAITRFGSIVVNGTIFDTTNAAVIIIDGKKGVGDDAVRQYLDIGKVVTVDGTVSDGNHDAVAWRVTYRSTVSGPVEKINAAGSSTQKLVVLGQTIKTDSRTRYNGITPDTVSLKDVIEVSGLTDHTGAIRATYLEKIGDFIPGLSYSVTGKVRNLDTGSKQFRINELVVDFNAAEIGALPGGRLENGMVVEVEGLIDASGGLMYATKIESSTGVRRDEDGEVELEGLVTQYISEFEFTVGDQAVETDEETMFVGGRPEDIRLDTRLEVEGELAGGVLLASEVEFWNPNRIEIQGPVTEVISIYEFSVGKQRVRADENTVYEDVAPEEIVVGIQLEVEGVIVNGTMFADKIAIRDD
jgi:hypothetical protein